MRDDDAPALALRGIAMAQLGDLVRAKRSSEDAAAKRRESFRSERGGRPSSALALALGASHRTVQRALDALATGDKVQWFGRGRARRWMTPPVPGFMTTLLLPTPLPTD